MFYTLHAHTSTETAGFLVKMNFILHAIIYIPLSFSRRTRMFSYTLRWNSFQQKLYNPKFSTFLKISLLFVFSSLEF